MLPDQHSPADQSSHPHSPVTRAAAPAQALTTPIIIIMTPYNAIRLMTVNYKAMEPNILSSPGPGQVEGQEGLSQVRSSSENSKLKDLDLSFNLFLVFTTKITQKSFQV